MQGSPLAGVGSAKNNGRTDIKPVDWSRWLTAKTLLLAGVAMPVIYFVTLFGAALLYPDFSHIRQQPSELGADGAPYNFAFAFNVALVVVGLSGLAGAAGLVSGLSNLQVGRTLSLATGLAPALPSVSLLISGLFPLPSPYHSSLVLLLIGILTPLLGALSLRKLADTTAVCVTLYLAFIAAVAVVGIILGIGNLISEDNVGLWIRIWAGVSFPAIAILCIAVRTRLQ